MKCAIKAVLKKIEWVLLAALLVAIGFAFLGRSSLRKVELAKQQIELNYATQGRAFKALEDNLQAANKTLAERDAAALKRDAENTTLKKALNEALEKHPEWSRARVPDSVWDALGAARGPGPRTNPSGPASKPAGAASNSAAARG